MLILYCINVYYLLCLLLSAEYLLPNWIIDPIRQMITACRQLVGSGMSHVDICAGENLSYEDERITWAMTPAELIMEDEHRPFGSLACVLVENDGALEEQLYPVKGPEDSEFIRGPVPMTKSEVRRLSLEKTPHRPWRCVL